jgi:hypothetical protein
VVISKAGRPVADLVPHRAAAVTFGGLKGELTYDDSAFGIDPDIQEMFYGDAASWQPGPWCGCWTTARGWGCGHGRPSRPPAACTSRRRQCGN